MNVFAIMATCGRHRCAERALTCFLKQDYQGEHTLLIHNNSPVSQSINLPPLPANKHVILLNRSTDEHANRYASLGAIYNDSIKVVPSDADLIIFWDDDDMYLPNHITSGVEGYKKAQEEGFRAYKPFYSFYRHSGGITLVANNMEPSVFVQASEIKRLGFSNTTSDQHMQWYAGLGDKIFVDMAGKPTLIYNWGDGDKWMGEQFVEHIPTFKTSGNPGNPSNFENYRGFSQEHGDEVLTPIADELIAAYYAEVINQNT